VNQSTSHPHHDFIKDNLPSWYVYTTSELRQRLQLDMVRGQHIRAQIAKALADIKGLTEFAKPLLSQALDKEFGPGLDVEKDYFFHVRFEDGLLPLPGKLTSRNVTVQSLLQAALQNFHQEEVDAVKAESTFFRGEPNFATLANGTSYPHPLKVSPARFMALCRRLDLGGKYQAHLNRTLGPSTEVVVGRVFSPAQIKDLLAHKERNSLYVEAHIAHMKGKEILSHDAYQAVLSVAGYNSAHKISGNPVEVFFLTILGFSVRDVLVFQARGESVCVIYMPAEPTAPLKEYDSFDQFMREFRSKLRGATYQQYFGRFIAQRSKAAFFSRLNECLTPHRLRPVPGDTGLIPRQWNVAEVDENANLKLEQQQIPYTLLEYFYFQKMLRIKDDARVLAVPTGDEDEESRRARLAGYIEHGMDIVNIAALFIPVLGEVMMVVAGAQLLVETFQGVAAWTHGDMDEALDHLASIAENVALLAVFAAAGKVASPAEIPPIEGSSFVGKMIPVKLSSGETRLWSPDLAPFAQDVVLPEGLQPTTEGVITHEGKHYIALEGTFYRVEHDEVLNKWRIVPPRGERLSPVLDNNGAGAWRHEGEDPRSWDAKTSFKRLGYSVASLSEQAIEDVMTVTGTDESLLQTLHLDNQIPPPALTDTIERFAVDQQVLIFDDQINDGTRFELANPQLQLELLPSVPGWPEGRVIHVLDAQATALSAQGVYVLPPGRPIVVTQAQIAKGKLMTAVLDGLSESERARIFGPGKQPTSMNLAFEVGRLSGDRLSLLFDKLYQARQVASDPLVKLIKRDFPTISSAVARELLAEADATQIAEMKTTQRIPLSLAGRARGYLQETRLNRALEGFFLASKADNPDTQTLALHLLEHLPGWPRDLRIEVREGAFGGRLLDGIGERSATQRRILVKRGNRYQAFDARGNELHPDLLEHDNFFSAVLHALPDASRQAIGFPDAETQAWALRNRIVSVATTQREQASRILGHWEIKPGFRGPSRLADGRFGYVLSGRGQLSRFSDGSDGVLEAMQMLYPEAPDLQMHLQNLRFRGWTVTQLMASTQARVQSYEVLRSALQGWAEPTGAGPSLSAETLAARRSVADTISRAWRYSEPQSPLYSTNMLLENLDLSGVTGLPNLPEHYSQINYLTLRNVTAEAERMNEFLGRFPNLRRLEILCGGSTRLPSGLTALTRLNHLSLEGMGLTIDQDAMNLLMDLPQLEELDLSNNILGEITDTSQLGISMLWLNSTGLTEWPQWTENLGLTVLDISDNQIEHLPEYIIENSVGEQFQLTVHAYGNPFVHDELRRYWLNDHGYGMTYRLEYDFPEDIRELDVFSSSGDSTTSSDDEADWHVHNHAHDVPSAPVPTVEIWQIEGRTELNSRVRIAWQRVEEAGDAPNLLILLQRLREAPDFTRFHEELTNDVMNVLEAAAEDTPLRGELEIMANDRLFGADQTCEDGARLIFSDIQVAVYARAALQGVPEAQHTATLFRVIRSLFRLNQVQTIADLEIASREARGLHVDHAEVRMAYRIGLAGELGLPAQPLSMAWDRLAAVDRQAILDARRLVLERETGPEFLEYATTDRRWNERLRAEHQADLERVTATIRAQMAELEEHPPLDADEYDRQGRALIASREAAEKALLEQLTDTMRQAW